MISLLIAGGAYLGTLAPQAEVEMFNHTLRGERVLASDVVCRNRWGTPMLPNGKGGYSVIAPINAEHIALSLQQPPVTSMPVYRPVTVTITEVR